MCLFGHRTRYKPTAPDKEATAEKSPGTAINPDPVFHELPRGTVLPPVGRPSPIHNRSGETWKSTSDGQHHECSEESHPGSQKSSGKFVSTSLTDEKGSLSTTEVMPRNDKPPPHGPSPAGNKKTDILDFAAPSTVLDRVILESFPGSGESQREHSSKHESDEPNAPHATKKEDHPGGSPMKNGAVVGKTVASQPNDGGNGTGSRFESLEGASLTAPSSQKDVLTEGEEVSGGRDSSAKSKAPPQESSGTTPSDHAKHHPSSHSGI